MKVRRRHRRSPVVPSVHEAVAALTECPPPWQPIDRALDDRYRLIVSEYGPALLRKTLARPEARAWLLVRYLPNVPTELVERALASLKREAAAFCELAGGTPDVAAAETWEAQWRASTRVTAGRRRAAS